MFNNRYGKSIIMRLLGLLLAAGLMMGSAFAEGDNTFFAQFDGMTWSFCSGAGAWSTDLTIQPDGSFIGDYHDSDMGDTGDNYPNGTIYICSFSGRFSVAGQPEDNAWLIRVEELAVDEPAEKETIDDGLRFIYTEPYGICEGDEMTLYAPGTPISGFTEDMLFWSHVLEQEDTLYELESWFLWSETNNSGFVAFPYEPGTRYRICASGTGRGGSPRIRAR